MAEIIKNMLSSRLGFEIEEFHDKKQKYIGFYSKDCWRYDEDEKDFVGDVECEHNIVVKILSILTKIVEEVAEKFGEKLSYILITPAPSLNIWGVTAMDPGMLYAIWINRNAPEDVLEVQLYRCLIPHLAKLDPSQMFKANPNPFISIDDIVAELKAKGITIKEVNNGYLFQIEST